MMGGQIGLSSDAGFGSTFAFFVKAYPFKHAQRRLSPDKSQDAPSTETMRQGSSFGDVQDRRSASATSSKSKTISPKRQSSPLNVLVLEDNLVNQQVLCRQLRNRGHQVKAANHGAEGLTALRTVDPAPKSSSTKTIAPQTFDVVLCDIEMPVMNGTQFVREVRKLEKQGLLPGHIPIIAVTANARSGQVGEAIEAGTVRIPPFNASHFLDHRLLTIVTAQPLT